MAGRIDNFLFLPPELPPVPEGKISSERVSGLPERFNDPQLDRTTQVIANRLLLNLNAVKEDLLLLKASAIFTLDDYKELVTFSNTELSTLNALLGASPSIIVKLADLEARVAALETP